MSRLQNALRPESGEQSGRWLPFAAAGSWLSLIALWLIAITVARETAALPAIAVAARVLTLTALALTGALLLRATSGASRWLVLLVVVTAAIRLAGIEHEVEERYYRDEGTYYHHATKINSGEALRYSFVYPHFLYYADAFILWLVSLFLGPWSAVAGLLGIHEPVGVEWLALRVAAALFSASAVIPVFALARRLGGRSLGKLAAILGGALMAFSPLFNEGSHVNISDGPSAVFATFCLFFVGRLIDRERVRDYLLAGMFSGLAAATKYPAGVVAVAICAVWLKGCWERRRPTPYLLWAGLASLGSFVAVMPSLLVAPHYALFGDRGIFFGLRQYSGGGWIGVMPTSNTSYYGGLLWDSFGPAAVLGGLGLALLLLRRRGFEAVAQRLAWILAFPLTYLGLIISMNMVVARNLYPALPALSALFGLGAAALLSTALDLARSAASPLRRRLVWAIGLCAILLWPVTSTAIQALAFARPSTRQIAARWISEHLPPGSGIVKEAYTPHLPRERFPQFQRRFVPRIPHEQIHDGTWEYLLLARNAYGRFLNDEAHRRPHHEDFAQRYRALLAYPEVMEFVPSRLTRGPVLRLLRIPEPEEPVRSAIFLPQEAFLPDGSMRPPTEGRPIRYTRPGQWSLFKKRMEAGSYRLLVDAALPGPLQEPQAAFVRVVAVDGTQLHREELGSTAEGHELATSSPLELGPEKKIFLYIYLPEGARLRRATLEELSLADAG